MISKFYNAILSLSVLLLATAPAAAQTLPNSYHGVWQNMEGKTASCSSLDWNGPKHSDTHIRISTKEIEFHEGRCRLTSLKDNGIGDFRLTMSCASEGDKYRTTQIWAIRDVRGHRMLITTGIDRPDAATQIYQSCANEAAPATR